MIEPVAFEILGLQIRWYGIYYAVGFLFSYFFIMHFAKYFNFMEKEKLENVFLFFMIFSVIGGRVFYGIFYNLPFYISNPVEIFSVWKGGMSIHGGFIGGGLTLFYFAKKYNWNVLKLCDLFVIPGALGLSFGRLANFVNQELVGKVTSSNLGVVFELYDDKNRWPVTLFAGFKNLIVFEILLFMKYFINLKSGVIAGWFLILYNFGRFFVDFLREPTVSLGFLSMGQILCLIFGLGGVWLLFYVSKKNDDKNLCIIDYEDKNYKIKDEKEIDKEKNEDIENNKKGIAKRKKKTKKNKTKKKKNYKN